MTAQLKYACVLCRQRYIHTYSTSYINIHVQYICIIKGCTVSTNVVGHVCHKQWEIVSGYESHSSVDDTTVLPVPLFPVNHLTADTGGYFLTAPKQGEVLAAALREALGTA